MFLTVNTSLSLDSVTPSRLAAFVNAARHRREKKERKHISSDFMERIYWALTFRIFNEEAGTRFLFLELDIAKVEQAGNSLENGVLNRSRESQN